MISRISGIQQQRAWTASMDSVRFGKLSRRQFWRAAAAGAVTVATGGFLAHHHASKSNWHIDSMRMTSYSTLQKPIMYVALNFTNKYQRPQRGTSINTLEIKFHLKRLTPATPQQPLLDLALLENLSKKPLAKIVEEQIAPHMEKSLDAAIASYGDPSSDRIWNLEVASKAFYQGKGKDGVQVGKDWKEFRFLRPPEEQEVFLDVIEIKGVRYGVQVDGMGNHHPYMEPSSLDQFRDWIKSLLP